jgi:hypothetical protein
MYAIDCKTLDLRSFENGKAARNAGNGFVLFEDADELLNNPNIKSEACSFFVELYNKHADKSVTKFESRNVAASRIVKLASSMPVEKSLNSKTGEDEVTEEVVEVNVKTTAPTKQTRKSGFAGKMVQATCQTNPRRVGTHGFHSMQVLIDAGEPISYEKYIAAGGRRNDLVWDIEKGNAKVID